MTTKTSFFFLIIVLAFLLRFINLSTTPPSLYWDEVAIGYNAYSILHTGRDEYGHHLPFWFQSFNDYKLPGYIYLTSLSIAFFGFTDFAIRAPSALAGVLTTIYLFFLSRELLLSLPPFRQKQFSHLPLISAFLFAISPWSLQFSRAAFEANLALAFTTAASFHLLFGLRRRPRHLYLASLFFVLSIITYHSSRLFVPLFILSFALTHRHQIRPHISTTLKAFLLGILLLLPTLPHQIGPQGSLRAMSTSYITDLTPLQSLHQFQTNYLDNFNTNYLFFYGDTIGRHSVRTLGMLYYFQIPTIILGLYLICKLPRTFQLLLGSWLLLAPIPASLTSPSPHALRSLIILPPWTIISALGFSYILHYLARFHTPFLKFGLTTLFSLGVCYNIGIYLFQYHFIYPLLTAPDWTYGAKQAIELINTPNLNADQIYLTDQIPPVYLATYLPILALQFQTLPHAPTDPPLTYQNITYFNKAWNINLDHTQNNLIIAPWTQPPPDYSTNFGTITAPNGDVLYNYWYEDASI